MSDATLQTSSQSTSSSAVPLEWEAFDPFRQYLTLQTKAPISLTAWQASVVPRWRERLVELIHDSDSTSSDGLDALIAGFGELWNAVLFLRLTSRQAVDLLRQVNNKLRQQDAQQGDGGKRDAAPSATEDSPHVLLSLATSEPVKTATIESLRWSVEFAMMALEQLGGQSAMRDVADVISADRSRAQQRILCLLEVVEKSGILTRAELIGTIPYAQLDSLGYCVTRDRLSLMKLNVRVRTKEVFTLTAFNMEGENVVGYAQFHVFIQEALSSLCSQHGGTCSCQGGRYDHWDKRSTFQCPTLMAVAAGLRALVAEFHLCSNRISHLLLLYYQHFLFVLRHDLLYLFSCLISRNRLQELVLFQLRYYEDAINKSLIKDRRTDLIASQATGLYLPAQRFFHLCAYLIMERILDLDAVWRSVGPSEAALRYCTDPRDDSSRKPGEAHPLNGKVIDRTETESLQERLVTFAQQSGVNVLSALKVQPLGKFWYAAKSQGLLSHLRTAVPSWSYHLSQHILTAIGSFVIWLGHPLLAKSKHSITSFFCLPSALQYSEDLLVEPSRAVGCHRSPYHYGLSCFVPEEGKAAGLAPVRTPDEFDTHVLPILTGLETALGDMNPYVLDLVLDMLDVVCVARGLVPPDDGTEERLVDVPETYIQVLQQVILPSLWLLDPRPALVAKVWRLVQYLSLEQRLTLFLNIFHRGTHASPRLAAASQAVRRMISRDLKRVTAEHSTATQKVGMVVYVAQAGGGRSLTDVSTKGGAQSLPQRERIVMDTLHKLCCLNPFEVFDCILHQVDLFDTMLIKVIINYLHSLPTLSVAVAAFLVAERAQTRECLLGGTWLAGQSKPKRLRNTAHFAARFLSRFPHKDLKIVVLSSIARILQETREAKYPDVLAGYFGDMVYLEELITWVGEVPKVFSEELSEEQIHCLAAGPALRFLILVDDERLEEHYRHGASAARLALKRILSERDIFRAAALGLSKLKLEIQYDSQLQCGAKLLQLREVASFTDELQSALLQLIEFVAQPDTLTITSLAQARREFSRVLPSVDVLSRYCDCAVAWLFIRHALPPLYASSEPQCSQEMEDAEEGTMSEQRQPNDSVREPEECLKQPGFPISEVHLPAIVQRMFPVVSLSSGTRLLYTAFWRLGLQDIWVPTAVYEKQIALLQKDLQQVALEKQRCVSRKSPDVASWEVISKRLSDWLHAFETELATLREHTERTIEVLKQQNDLWFKAEKTDANPMNMFIQHMLGPRILNSQHDALFCTKFVQLLVDMDTEGFLLSDFFNKWTGMLTPLVRSCSIQEADYLGLFMNEMASMMNKWIREPETLRQAARDNKRCFARLITRIAPAIVTLDDTVDVEMDLTKPVSGSTAVETAELMKSIQKWENRIFRVIQHGLSLTEKETSWMSQRIVIKFLNKTHQNFPITDVAGSQILRSLPAVIRRAKEVRWDDVVANAKALDRNLKSVQKTWLKRREDDEEDVRIVPASDVVKPKDTNHRMTVSPAVASVTTRQTATPPNSSRPGSSETGSTTVSHPAGPKNPFHATLVSPSPKTKISGSEQNPPAPTPLVGQSAANTAQPLIAPGQATMLDVDSRHPPDAVPQHATSAVVARAPSAVSTDLSTDQSKQATTVAPESSTLEAPADLSKASDPPTSPSKTSAGATVAPQAPHLATQPSSASVTDPLMSSQSSETANLVITAPTEATAVQRTTAAAPHTFPPSKRQRTTVGGPDVCVDVEMTPASPDMGAEVFVALQDDPSPHSSPGQDLSADARGPLESSVSSQKPIDGGAPGSREEGLSSSDQSEVFKKQKEIEELRERMKSKHRHRSQSTSAPPPATRSRDYSRFDTRDERSGGSRRHDLPDHRATGGGASRSPDHRSSRTRGDDPLRPGEHSTVGVRRVMRDETLRRVERHQDSSKPRGGAGRPSSPPQQQQLPTGTSGWDRHSRSMTADMEKVIPRGSSMSPSAGSRYRMMNRSNSGRGSIAALDESSSRGRSSPPGRGRRQQQLLAVDSRGQPPHRTATNVRPTSHQDLDPPQSSDGWSRRSSDSVQQRWMRHHNNWPPQQVPSGGRLGGRHHDDSLWHGSRDSRSRSGSHPGVVDEWERSSTTRSHHRSRGSTHEPSSYDRSTTSRHSSNLYAGKRPR